ncbi:glucosyltransferase [Dyella lipolytica]|uniref:Glycosyltransferase family 1 protein n=1 Tax=Dyella lipolytica TaxID=1867835 RepID=A0ABW8IQ82_9GAMM|nr:glycosyltransferase [Dyella lipolytica]GLQ45192.1 glucosyltransferase [Dyella lipolytica]
MRSAHIVITTFGSLGDLFPFLAVGQVLQARGHRVTIATHTTHRATVAQAGLRFADASGMPEPEDRAQFTARAFDHRRGPHFVVHDLAAGDVRASYAKLKTICDDADVLITSSLAFAGQILGETLSAAGKLPWISAVLAPASFVSAYDPPTTGMAWVDALTRDAPRRVRVIRHLFEWGTRHWTAPVRALRRELGLRAVSSGGDPFHRGQHSPDGVLALFSPLIGKPQLDWPANTHVTGFAHYAQPGAKLDAELDNFLREGSPPLVFTLGSAAVHIGADFLRASITVAERLNRRAVLFTGTPAVRAQLPAPLPATIRAVDYAPHAAVFPHAAAIVHHGGIGTSTEALRAGRPMLVVPHGFDQFDNAARLQRLGVAHVLHASSYSVEAATPLLRELLDDAQYGQHAWRCAEAVRAEHGATTAADVIEATLRRF